MADLGAWHGDPELKARIVARMKQHREADAFVHGLYQRLEPKLALGYKGCAIGCALDPQPADPETVNGITYGQRPVGSWWGEVERQFGIPRLVAELIDDCFEALWKPDDADFAVDALAAIAVGAELSGIWEAYWEAVDEPCEPDVLLRVLREAPTTSRLEVVTPNGQ